MRLRWAQVTNVFFREELWKIDAPLLWFQTLKQTLEDLGFIQSPFDACTFSLVTPQPDGEPLVRGVLGVHVDDGIGKSFSVFAISIALDPMMRVSLFSRAFVSVNGMMGASKWTRLST